MSDDLLRKAARLDAESDWREILNQRAREAAFFRAAGMPMPAYGAPATDKSLFVRLFRWLRK